MFGTLAAVAAAVTVLVATYGTLEAGNRAATVAGQAAKTAEEGLDTERFKNGVDELGDADESVQAGGILTLVRVAGASPTDADTAYKVILSFLRRHLCDKKVDESVRPIVPGPSQPVVVGLQALRAASRTIDLSRIRCLGADLTGVDLTGARLEDADLSGTRLWAANLTGADLRRSILDSADFSHGDFLQGATLTRADLRGAIKLTRTNLANAIWTQPPLVDSNKASWLRRGP